MVFSDYVAQIDSAKVYDVARVTALDRARRLSDRLGANVLLKREDTQAVHSFKIRGAYNKMSRLSAAERAKGVLAASAGKHAQGVALSANVLGMKATIVSEGQSREIARALGETLNLQMTTAEERRSYMY